MRRVWATAICAFLAFGTATALASVSDYSGQVSDGGTLLLRLHRDPMHVLLVIVLGGVGLVMPAGYVWSPIATPSFVHLIGSLPATFAMTELLDGSPHRIRFERLMSRVIVMSFVSSSASQFCARPIGRADRLRRVLFV